MSEQLQVLTKDHPQFEQFCSVLEGPLGCDFKKDSKGKITWKCKGGHDQSKSRKILKRIPGIDVEGTLAYFTEHGGHCDCEVLFNVAS